MLRFPVLPIAILFMGVSSSLAHEFWIEPEKYQAPIGDVVTADVKNGQDFAGSAQPFFPNRQIRTEVNGATYEGRAGDLPAFQIQDALEGLTTLIVETAPASLKYREWTKFLSFLEDKNMAHAAAAHEQRGLPDADFWETYSRYSKALVAVGDGTGRDRRQGLLIEFVALDNPYLGASATLRFQLWHGDAPLADTQVTVFDKSPNDTVAQSRLRTDQEGRITVPVHPGHRYLLDAVVIRPVEDGSRAVWHTDWAALTFGIPQR